MIFTELKLKGAFAIGLERKEDDRGFFARTFCREEFEAHGLNPNDASDARKTAPNGYTYLENYLNGTNPNLVASVNSTTQLWAPSTSPKFLRPSNTGLRGMFLWPSANFRPRTHDGFSSMPLFWSNAGPWTESESKNGGGLSSYSNETRRTTFMPFKRVGPGEKSDTPSAEGDNGELILR